MTVRAKFKLFKVESSMMQNARENPDGSWAKDENGRQIYDKAEIRTLTFSPVYGNGDRNHENTKFWNASPSGELRLGTINPEAWSQFELDKEYYLDFTEAPP